MTQEELKQRLIELLVECDLEHEVLDCFHGRPLKRQAAEIIADHLIANGVTIRERGEWTSKGDGVWMCNHCEEEIVADAYGDIHPADDCDWIYCPHCGADMRGVKDE